MTAAARPRAVVAIDVCYREDGSAKAAAIALEGFGSAEPLAAWSVEVARAEPYEPGQFWKRELPCLMAALGASPVEPSAVVVDAFVDLDAAGRPGLGRRLWEELGRSVPVVGVAKTGFCGADASWGLLRGQSAKPLWVTAAGMGIDEARAHVAKMAGPHRIPAMLREVDRLCRQPSPAKPLKP